MMFLLLSELKIELNNRPIFFLYQSIFSSREMMNKNSSVSNNSPGHKISMWP